MEQVVADIRKEQQEAFQEMRDGGGIDREAVREMMEEMQTKTNDGLMGVLNDKQKKAFAKMKGKEFKFPERRGRRGGQAAGQLSERSDDAGGA